MINLLLGAPGGGKSYEAVVYHILPALALGRKVITNLPLNLEAFAAIDATYVPLIELRTKTGAQREDVDWDKAKALFQNFGIAHKGKHFNPAAFSAREDYGDPWRHPTNRSGPLYVIDECHLPLPRSGTPIEVEEWYSLHRHESADVLLITQSYGKINAAIRDLVQVVYRVRKNIAFGSSGSYTRKVQDGLRGEVVNTSIRRYDKRHFGLYRSHTKGGGTEMESQDVRPIWRHWTFMGAGAMAIIFLIMLASGWVRNPLKPPPAPVAKAQAAPARALPASSAPVPSSSAASKPEPAKPKERPDDPLAGKGLHMVGWLKLGERERTFFAVAQNGQRVMELDDADLVRLGYRFERTGHCLGKLTWNDSSRVVLCDSPAVSVPIGGGGFRSRGAGGTPLAGGTRDPSLGAESPRVEVTTPS